jgi:hypothetical protein
MNASLRATLLLLAGTVLLPMGTKAAPPPAPANIRAVILPAEVLFTWDASPGADYYRLYRGGPTRRWVWLPPVAEPRLRDTDFVPLPGYYQIGAFNNAGQTGTSPEFIVSNVVANISLYGVTPRPLSDTSFAVAWTISGPQPFTGYGHGGGGDGMFEVGPDLQHMTLVGATRDISERHEFIADNLQPNTTYYYRLTSAGTNNAGFTYCNTFTTRAFTPPPPTVITLPGSNPTLAADIDMPVGFTLTTGNPDAPFQEFFILGFSSGAIWGTSPQFTYLSNPKHSGFEYIDVFYNDGLISGIARINVNIRYVPFAPIAQDLSVTTVEDIPKKFLMNVVGPDFDPTQLNYEIVAGPTNGVLSGPYGSWKNELQYNPNTNYAGIDHLTYRCYANNKTSNLATVRFYVQPTNDAPIATSQSVTVTAGVARSFSLNAIDPDGDTLQFQLMTNPTHVVWSGFFFNPDGQITYTPVAGYTGPDNFSYRVTDPSGAASMAVVSITVVPPPLPAVPSGLVATAGPRSRIDLTWTDNSSNEDGFKIERSLSATSGWAEIATVGPNIRTYSATGQKPNKIYYFRVRAFNLSGNSAYSNIGSAKAKN